MLEEEIDLRPYIELLIRRWYIIVGAAVLAGLAAFAFTALQDDVYEATALIAVTEDRLIARFDPRLDTTDARQPVEALPELATSDEFLGLLLEKIDIQIDGIDSLEDLRKQLSAEAGADPTIIRLRAKDQDPKKAADIANLWAEQFVILSNDIYGDGGLEQVTFFEEQLVQAGDDLAAAEYDLVLFQGINRTAVLSNTMASLQQQQRFYLDRQQETDSLVSDVQDLHAQIEAQSSSAVISFADQLTALVLQLRAYNAAQQLPIQIQLDNPESLSEASRSEQATLLESMLQTMDERSEAIKEDLIGIEPELLQIQEELQESQAEYNRLQLNRDIAEETYQSLARKVDEEKITANDMTRGIRLASRAAVPEEPESSRAMTLALLTTIFIAAVVILIISIIHWASPGDKSD